MPTLPRLALPLSATCLVAVLAACPPEVEPAPEDLDGVAHWLWLNYTLADDTAVADAVNKLHRAADGETRSEPMRGRLTRLQSADLAVVGMEHKDPKKAVGIFAFTALDCDLKTVEELVYELDQKRFFPEGYQSYNRRYTSDFDAYKRRDDPFLSWDVDIDAIISGGVLNVPYSESIKGGIRYTGTLDGVEGQSGPFLVSHTWMPEPAVFEDDVNSFSQDYQISVYYEPKPGRVLHLYGIWRQMYFGGIGLGTDDNWVQDIQLDNLIKWDERVQEICATWPDVP
ncbi:MAG: hypothetical protein ABIJ09_21370 [Pseudomonadota bacterium]